LQQVLSRFFAGSAASSRFLNDVSYLPPAIMGRVALTRKREDKRQRRFKYYDFSGKVWVT
jgi:hypothetical protein